MIIAGTGHRPKSLAPYSYDTWHQMARLIREAFAQLQPTLIISGFALGWDLTLAEIAEEQDLPLIAAIPFPQQCKQWTAKETALWRRLRLYAKATGEVHVLGQSFEQARFQLRNEWMVDRADHILALYNGGRGGTGNCIEYALRVGKPVTNLWDRFQALRAAPPIPVHQGPFRS